MDWGKDHYATVTWSDAPDNRRIAIAWMTLLLLQAFILSSVRLAAS
jgi:sucrose-6-phosphate hydrolase SacC (GH32 family)